MPQTTYSVNSEIGIVTQQDKLRQKKMINYEDSHHESNTGGISHFDEVDKVKATIIATAK